MGARFVQDVLDIMRVVLGRRNLNDPDSTDDLFLTYLNNFVSLRMPNDTKLFESFGTMTFTIDPSHTDGVYTFNDLGLSQEFMNISAQAFISLLNPINNSVSWNQLPIYQDPGEFFMIWGINNEEILIPGYPTTMLYYGNQFTFRTIPDKEYQVQIYGYKKNPDYGGELDKNGIPILPPDIQLQYDYWLRYLAYGASRDYARDFRYEAGALARIESTFKSERINQMTHAHNQAKMSRAMPRF